MRTTKYKIKSRQGDAEQWLPLADIQRHLLLIDSSHNTLLELYRDAAIASAEKYMNRAILDTEVEAYFPVAGSYTLPYGAYDVLDDTPYNPITNAVEVAQDAVVTFIAGFDGGAPAALKLAVLLHVADMFEIRQSTATGFSVSEIPFSHEKVLDLFRLNGGAL